MNYTAPIDPETGKPQMSDEEIAWREASRLREADLQQRVKEAERILVHVAKGPIVGAILIANLITAAVVWLLYALTH